MARNNNNESSAKMKRKNPSRWTVTREELAGDESSTIPWEEMNRIQRIEHVICILLKIAFLLFIIFTFICTLALLADAFKLIGGKGIGDAVQNSKIIQNPISASIVGMVITLILQSSSTLISILVGMVAGGIITVHQAIPVMMGAEIGASFFNALISLGQSGNRDQFRRAFAAATMNDIFNFLAYIVILPLEMATGVIEIVSGIFVNPLSGARSSNKFQTLNVITDPILHKIIQLNEEALSKIATNTSAVNEDTASSANESLVLKCSEYTSEFASCPYDHLFANSSWSDTWIGITLLAMSIFLLVLCLLSIVHLLNSLLAGQIAIWVRRIIDKQLPHPFGWLTNYLIMLFGCFVVMIVQSSGVFRSALIPLCGIGVVTLERFYPLLLGANVGTTFTGVLAALSADPKQIKETMQIALCQTVYNILSILFFYPIPFTRRIPITLAMKFGDLTAKYRWFALVYIAFVFFLMPGTLLLISFLPPGLTISILALLGGFLAFIVLVNAAQNRCPHVLPTVLQNWEFLPKHLHSLEPYDRIMTKLLKMLPFFRSSNSSQNKEHQQNNQMKRNEEGGEEKQQVRIPFRFISPQFQHSVHPFHSSTNIPPTTQINTNSTHFPTSVPNIQITHHQTDV